MPVARHSACEIEWHRLEQPITVVAVCGVLPVAAIVVPMFPADTYRHYRGPIVMPLLCVIHMDERKGCHQAPGTVRTIPYGVFFLHFVRVSYILISSRSSHACCACLEESKSAIPGICARLDPTVNELTAAMCISTLYFAHICVCLIVCCRGRCAIIARCFSSMEGSENLSFFLFFP